MLKKYHNIFLCLIFLVSGCGYTTRSLLPTEFKSIHIENFVNAINVTKEITDDRMYVGYKPGLEIDVTKAIIDKFLFDGNLKVAQSGDSDLILKGELTDFKREALRYDANDNVEEYRARLTVDIELVNARTKATVWKENGFSGETTYRTSGALAKSETAAINDTAADLARRVVERTIEGW